MNFQKSLPVITSVAIILVVALLRDRSRTAAAIFATMPINIPLALWVVSSGADTSPQMLADFTRSLMIGLVPAFVWLGVVYGVVRTGAGLFAAIGAGYAVWVVIMLGMVWLGLLTLPR